MSLHCQNESKMMSFFHIHALKVADIFPTADFPYPALLLRELMYSILMAKAAISMD